MCKKFGNDYDTMMIHLFAGIVVYLYFIYYCIFLLGLFDFQCCLAYHSLPIPDSCKLFVGISFCNGIVISCCNSVVSSFKSVIIYLLNLPLPPCLPPPVSRLPGSLYGWSCVVVFFVQLQKMQFIFDEAMLLWQSLLICCRAII